MNKDRRLILLPARRTRPRVLRCPEPDVLFRVGAKGGEVGTVEIQDLLFKANGPTAGLVAVGWNMEAEEQNTAAMWDCHVCIGGAEGSDL